MQLILTNNNKIKPKIMKKFISIIISVLLFTSLLNAQKKTTDYSIPSFNSDSVKPKESKKVTHTITEIKTEPKRKSKFSEEFLKDFKFGIKMGYDMHPLTSSFDEIKNQIKTNGIEFGFFTVFGKVFYAQPEFYYYEYSPIINNIHEPYKIKGLSLPVMFGIRFLDVEILSLRVMTGPSVSYDLIGQTYPENHQRFRYNWQVGVGTDFFDFITADLRYSIINGVNISQQISDFNPQTSVLNLTIGLKY